MIQYQLEYKMDDKNNYYSNWKVTIIDALKTIERSMLVNTSRWWINVFDEDGTSEEHLLPTHPKVQDAIKAEIDGWKVLIVDVREKKKIFENEGGYNFYCSSCGKNNYEKVYEALEENNKFFTGLVCKSCMEELVFPGESRRYKLLIINSSLNNLKISINKFLLNSSSYSIFGLRIRDDL